MEERLLNMRSSTHLIENDLYESLSYPAYSIAETSRLTRIGRWSVSRWLRGYRYEGGEQGPVIHRSIPVESTYASFLDLVDLLYVKIFIERGFSLQTIRKIADEAREYLGTFHFASKKFFTSEDKVFLELPDSMVTLLSDGQRAMGIIIKQVFDKLDFEDATGFDFAQRWYPEGKNGFIVIDPQISFGRPTLIGHSIATHNIYDLYLGENKQIDPVSEWFNIPSHEIKAAVQFERSLWA
jgi:uncharacterized protein (DUF433 family)